MSTTNHAWAQRQRVRWMRPNAHLYVRHDAWRFIQPGSPVYVGRGVVRYLSLDTSERPAANPGRGIDSDSLAARAEAERRELLRLKYELAALKADVRFRRLMSALKAFDPSQPRVPAGNPDGGQWTSEFGGNVGADRMRLAAADKPRFGPSAVAAIATDVAKRAIEAYRRANSLWDLFGGRIGTVAVTKTGDREIYGSNSTSPTYDSSDRAGALSLRDTLLEKYPKVMNVDDVGRRPNDAVFHAETTVLLRAARANGGALAGQSIMIHTDRALCRSCDKVLPLIGVELGNPTVTFVGPGGRASTMRNGGWIE